jgi:hypothetical protein
MLRLAKGGPDHKAPAKAAVTAANNNNTHVASLNSVAGDEGDPPLQAPAKGEAHEEAQAELGVDYSTAAKTPEDATITTTRGD